MYDRDAFEAKVMSDVDREMERRQREGAVERCRKELLESVKKVAEVNRTTNAKKGLPAYLNYLRNFHIRSKIRYEKQRRSSRNCTKTTAVERGGGSCRRWTSWSG